MSAAEYVAAITCRQSDRDARAAFQELVLRIAPPRATLFDFGCGPGIDACFYAERGFAVAAYDLDPQMCELFSMRCRQPMQTGHVTLERGEYADFLARRSDAHSRIDLVTANFAPLSLITDLTGLFAKFHALTRPGGKVLASVLNPYFCGDIRYGWWWRNVLALWRAGYYSIPGTQAPIVRRRLAVFASRSTPYFSLERLYPGLPARGIMDSGGLDVHRLTAIAWLQLVRCRYLFLLFQKQPLPQLSASRAVHRSTRRPVP